MNPTRAALVEALIRGIVPNPETWDSYDVADAILAQPAMARIKAVVEAAVAWQEENTPLPPHMIADMALPRRTPEADLWLAVDALLAEDSE